MDAEGAAGGVEVLQGLPVEQAGEVVEQAAHVADVGQVGDVAEDDGLIGEQGGGHQRQRGVLGALDGELAFEAVAAVNLKTIHGSASLRVQRAGGVAGCRFLR